MADEVKIPIVTTADTTGADATAASVSNVAQTVQQLADQAVAAEKANAQFSATLAAMDGVQLSNLSKELEKLVAETEKAGGKTEELKAKLDQVRAAGLQPRLQQDLRAAGRAAATTATDLGKLADQAEKGASAGRILGQVLSGNVGYLAQAAPLLRALWVALRANPIGLVVTALGALASGFVVLREKMGWFKKDTEEVAETTEHAAREVEEFARLGARFEKQQQELQRLRDSYESVTASVQSLRTAREGLNDAELGAILAGIDAEEATALRNPNLDARQRTAVRLDFSQRRERARQDAAETKAIDADVAARTALATAEEELKRNAEERVALGLQVIEAEQALMVTYKRLTAAAKARAEYGLTGRNRSGQVIPAAASLDKKIAGLQTAVERGRQLVVDTRKKEQEAEARDKQLLAERRTAEVGTQASYIRVQTTLEQGRTLRERQEAEQSALSRSGTAEIDRASYQLEADALGSRLQTGARSLLDRERAGGPSLGNALRDQLRRMEKAAGDLQGDATAGELALVIEINERIIAAMEPLPGNITRMGSTLRGLDTRLRTLEGKTAALGR